MSFSYEGICGSAPTQSQLRGIRDATRFRRISDEQVDRFLAFWSTWGLPLGESPLSLAHFINFEEYLSSFYTTRIRQIREDYTPTGYEEAWEFKASTAGFGTTRKKMARKKRDDKTTKA